MSKAPTDKKLSVLHAHSTYSVLDGASGVDDYIKWSKENGAQGLALTDHGWQIGLLELYTKAKKAGLTPIPGCEFYVAPDKDYEFAGKPYDYYHVTVWAVNEVGYRNLIKLGSISWNQDQIPGFSFSKKSNTFSFTQKDRVVKKWAQTKPRITFDELLTHHEGLVLGSGCLIGALNKAFLNGEFKGAERNLMKLLEVYRGRLFMEIMPHVCDHDWNRDTKKFEKNECTDWSPDGDLQRSANLEIIKLARKHGLPLVMTTDAHFTEHSMKPIQDVLLSQGEEGGWTFHNSYACMTTEDAWQHWSEVMGDDKENQLIFAESVENNDAIVEMAKDLVIKDEYRQPTPEYPIEIRSQEVSEADKMKATVLYWVDYHGRMNWDDPKYIDRLMYEIKVIADNGVENLLPYFIFLEKQARWAADHSILSAPGRGSGAGSLLCYLLKITHLDPFTFNLPFSRFLSNGRIKRGKFPDIDWDMGNRDLLVAYLRDTLGDLMAQCSTIGTLKLKGAIKDAASGILKWKKNDPRLEAVTKTIANEPMGVTTYDFLMGYKDADGNEHQGHLFENPTLQEFFTQYPAIFEAVKKLTGIPRSVGRHASAYLVSNRPIYESVPTCYISGVLCTQYNANAAFNAVEKAGLIKFDFLTVNTLNFISAAVREVQKKFGYKVEEVTMKFGDEEYKTTKGELRIDQLPMADGRILDIYQLPNDPATFRDLSNGRTESVFQQSSALMTGFTKRIRPNKLMDQSDIVALVRPGPLEAEVGEEYEGKPLTMTEAYILRRHGVVPVRYAHPDMEPILKDTYGVAVYQEQLQQMFQDLAGYNEEEADELREILAKKKKQELEKRLPELRRRLVERGWNEHQIEVFVSLCIASSAYSFNRAHSASYGIVAYMCAFLKTNYPLEWWTAVLQNAKIEDIREKGYASTLLKDGLLQLPHVNGPTDTFRLADGKVHAPLYLIDRVGDAACTAIRKAQEGGPFTSMRDFYDRVELRAVNEAVFHNLILCGTFDQIEPGKTPQELLTEYHYFKRVGALAIGRGKKGEELLEAVRIYKAKEIEKGLRLDVPILFADDLQTEIMRVKALAIYRVDVHDHFKGLLNKKGVTYGEHGAAISVGRGVVPVFQNTKEIEHAVKTSNEGYRGPLGVWAGFISDAEPFQYTDKKSGEKVTALKMQITNNGETVEAVLWPDLYAELGEPNSDKIVFIIGNVKESREPGKWAFSVSQIKYA